MPVTPFCPTHLAVARSRGGVTLYSLDSRPNPNHPISQAIRSGMADAPHRVLESE